MNTEFEKYRDIIDVDLYISSNYNILKYLPNYSVAVTLPLNLTKIKEIIISEGIIELEDNFYKNCMRLNKIILPNSLKKIGAYAFYGSLSLQNIEIPDGVTYLGNFAFGRCRFLKNVKLSNNLEIISNGCFFMSQMKEITIPASVEVIRDEAFKSSFELNEVIFEGELPDIEADAFDSCPFLYKIICGSKCYGTFDDLKDDILEHKKIRQRVFLYPDDLKLDVYKEEIEIIVVRLGIEEIKDFELAYFPNAFQVVFHETLKKIGRGAFLGCKKLNYINLPANLEEINPQAFYGCEAIKKLVIPEKIKHIDDETFKYCKSLKKLLLPEGIGGFDMNSLVGCDKLKELELPNSVTGIGRNHSFFPDVLYCGEGLFEYIKSLNVYNDIDFKRKKYKFKNKRG